MEHLYQINRMMFVGNGFGFEDLDDNTGLEILNTVYDYVRNKIKEHKASSNDANTE